ncbi:MAG: inner membrane CreD family protein [Thermoanaerobaculia bacterium]
MSVHRLVAILFILTSTAIAWFILGGSVLTRTGRSKIEGNQQVTSLWGDRHTQIAPSVSYSLRKTVTEEVTEKDGSGNAVTREIRRERIDSVPLALESSSIDVALDVDHRRKGLLWHDTYSVDFQASYRVQIPDRPTRSLSVLYSFPSPTAIYDDFLLSVNGKEIARVENLSAGVSQKFAIEPGAEAVIEIRYRSRGLDTWSYRFANSTVGQVRDFELTMTTDFDQIDFPAGSLSPTAKKQLEAGWRLDWRFDNLLSGQHIGIDIPNKLNPGPLTARITFFAPVSLLFFVTVLVMLGALRHLDLHPMHFFFLSAAFFSFHLLMAYLVDHINIHVAFAASAVVSLALVLSYLGIICGFRNALRYAGWSQFVFLVLFSYAFFFEGLTGLAVTIGSIITLFVLMQLTAKVDWNAVFETGRRPIEVEAG